MNKNESQLYSLFAACPKYVEDLAEKELAELGAVECKRTVAGLSFRGTLETTYRVCYLARIVSRVFLVLAEFEVASEKELYNKCRTVPWAGHFTPEQTISVSATAKQSFARNLNYLALVVKDAVVDSFRRSCDRRPDVDSLRPDIRLHIHLTGQAATLSLEMSGESLHRRGYRVATVPASLKENTAAVMLLRAGWDKIAAAGGGFVDPMCGSGTLLIEAAMLAAKIPVGSLHARFGFSSWKQHNEEIWQEVVTAADNDRCLRSLPLIRGYDQAHTAVEAARENIRRAGLQDWIQVEKCELNRLESPFPEDSVPGLIAVNPPYGQRLGEESELAGLYAELGQRLLSLFPGWKAVVLTANRDLSLATGLRARRTNRLCNGPLECLLSHFELRQDQVFKVHAPGTWQGEIDEALINRLKKNLRRLGKWARKQGIFCYRLYDADLPEFAAAVDFFEGKYLHIQEYAPPASIEPKLAAKRIRQLCAAAGEITGVNTDHIYLKQRKQQKGANQYNRQGNHGEFKHIREGGWRFKVNFTDYLDPGIFLLSRALREKIRSLAGGKRFLNLFAYTGTATVAAASGGAVRTVSVDTSNTYLEWARDNLKLNGLDADKHLFVRQDCLSWLRANRETFDLIFLEPPTFSNSKSRGEDFDIQRQHGELIRMCLSILSARGTLFFSTNFKRFKLDETILEGTEVTDLSRSTLPEDFARKPGMYHCWSIAHAH